MSIFDKIKAPPKEFSPAAFWFWYGALNPDELRRQIDLMTEQGVYNGFMHSRAYLKTPYLEDEWWDAISACVDEGEKTGFYPWLYDEYAWPSGTAGSTFEYGYQKPSKTLASGQKNMGKSLALQRFPSASEFKEAANTDANQSLLCLFCGEGTEFFPVEKENIDAAEGEILAFYVKLHPTLVDYMNKETIREFISYTHEEYKKRYGEHFGSRIPGVFFDEIYMNHFAPWTEKLPEEFRARRGYDLMPKLFALAVDGGEREREVRRDFYKTVAELYEEAFFDQIGSWCEENKLQLTGHTEEDIWLHPSRQGNYFNTVRHLQIPGADCHDYRYRFPRKITYREPKLAVSVSRAYGKERAMSEAFGGAGWACTLQEFKRGVNTAGAMGISMFTLHGFYSEIDHQGSQSDWPGNFFFQNPYWRYFKHFADYITRVCYINSLGTPVVDVALYYPIEDLQRETHIKGMTPVGRGINAAFNTVLNTLIENQIDVDMVDMESLMRAELADGRLCVGKERFAVLLMPDVVKPDAALAQKLEEFTKVGGKVIRYATQESASGELALPEEICKAVFGEFSLPRDVYVVGDNCDLFVNHRKIEDKDFYFVANSAPRARELTLFLRERGHARRLSPESGELGKVFHSINEEGTLVSLTLEEDEAVWIVIEPKGGYTKLERERVAEEMIVAGRWEFLPLPADLDGEAQIRQERTELKIPLATFSSSLQRGGRQIRIQNKEGELGNVGRHLSLWNASWITRRVGWKDSCSSKGLYFRRSLSLAQKPDEARICLSAVNEWSLYINGEAVCSSKEGMQPTTLDITAFLRAGENAVCVFVHNPTPLSKGTLLEKEELLPQLLISLIAEIEMNFGEERQTVCTDSQWITCESAGKDWISLDYKPAVSYIDASARSGMAPALRPTEWSWAWERGKPPMKPFGDLPRFGESLQYPQRVCYGIELPCGTAAVKHPRVSGEHVEILIDGIEACFKDGVCTLKPDGNTHYMQIILTANGEADGLLENVAVELVPQRGALCDWRLHGLKWYSGFASYKNSFALSKGSGRYILDPGQICQQAEVWVNGRKAGERVWAPYRLDITEYLKDGNNEIVIVVSNSAGVEHQFMLLDEGEAVGWNRYWNFDNIQREGEKLISGLLGPVKLLRMI
ncbi:MAG: hypothetical protein IJY39_06040 [Clostridia bacterium]|nr:hypothetical protein [Clostridia bacterium]